jgi:hypothetical protein
MPPLVTHDTGSAAASTVLASTPTVFVRDGSAWSELAALGPSRFRVRLGGLLRPSWMAALGSGLAERRISVDQVHAKRAHDGSWIAELSLVALEGASDPRGIPYIGLAKEPPPPVVAGHRLELDGYALLESADYGGTLKLEFDARDSLGLLGAMLSSLAALELFPIEMHIETHAGRAQDCLWLCGPGTGRPTAPAKHALEQMLRRSLVAAPEG